MGFVELLLLAVGLAMDAFAVSVCKGLSQPRVTVKAMVICGAWFGAFQALMPLIGYLLGAQFSSYVSEISPWIAFVLLAFIGGNMIREALPDKKQTECEEKGACELGGRCDMGAGGGALDSKTMFVMAVATSIDALAFGVTFACVPVRVFAGISELLNTLFAVGVIGAVTFVVSCAGVKIGGVFGSKYEQKAELAGGVILVCLGLKILAEHFGVL